MPWPAVHRGGAWRAIADGVEQDWEPVYLFPESAVRALAALEERRRILARPVGVLRSFEIPPRARELRPPEGWMDIASREQLARDYGLALVDSRRVRSAEECAAAAAELGGRVALKVSVPEVVHKSDEGAVLLDVVDAAAGYRQLAGLGAEESRCSPWSARARS